MNEIRGSQTSTGDSTGEMSKAVSDRSYDAEPNRGAGLSGAVHPVIIIVDHSGVVTALNTAAAHLLPRAAAGAQLSEAAPQWLVTAHRRVAAAGTALESVPPPESASGRVAGRTYEAYPTPLNSGSVMWWLVGDPGPRRTAKALAAERDRLAILVETFDALSTSLNVDLSMEVTARLAARHLADVAVVIAWTADGALTVTSGRADGATARCTLGADGAEVLRVPGLQEALQGYLPPPSRGVDPSEVPAWLVPQELVGDIGSAVVIPLSGHGMPAGALLLLWRSDAAASVDADETLLGPFAARAGAALAAARMYAEQVKIATALTQDLLPPQLPDVDGVELASGYRASNDSERVSGDFYDVHLGSPTDEPFVVLGDVCGKGLDAAVLTGKIRNTLHALLPIATDHHRLLDLLNRTLVDSHHAQFATLVLATVSRSGSVLKLRLTCAGHPAPLIVRVDGRVEEADTHGSLIGVLPTVHATTATVDLRPGETCLLYTDGLTEARGGPAGDMFGEERLRSCLTACAGLTAEAVVERVQALVTDWLGHGSRDDMATLAITAPSRP